MTSVLMTPDGQTVEAEVEEKFLTELTTLRSVLAEISLNATAFATTAKVSANGLNELGEWIASLKNRC